MPGFTEIAYLRQPKGGPVPSRITLGSAEGNGRMGFAEAAGNFLETFGQLAAAFPANTPRTNASFAVASLIYQFEGFRINATQIWTDLVDGDATPATRIEVHDALATRDPVADLVISFSKTDFNNIRPDSGTVVWGPDSGAAVGFNWTAREAQDLQNVLLAGYQATIVNDDSEKNVLPSVPGTVETALWCSVAPVFGDFAALAITGEDVLQSIASKSVTITTEYRPDLEDLDNTFRYGADSLGRPVIWRVLSTSRTERFIDINLTAAAI